MCSSLLAKALGERPRGVRQYAERRGRGAKTSFIEETPWVREPLVIVAKKAT
jgi:hypothetical protein